MANIDSVTAALRTDTGLVRSHNEDFVGSWEPDTPEEQNEIGWLYIVADGVGGAEAGDVASQHATEQTISHFIEGQNGNGESNSAENRLRNAIQQANDDLRRLAGERGRAGYMATTLTAAYIQNGHVLYANVGDSRGYHIHNGRMSQITDDHSLVAQLVREGAITEAEAAVHPRRNVILSSLGPTREPQIDLFDVTAQDGDVVLLCSDGLIRHVSDDEIARVALTEEPNEATKILVDLANARGGTDNISVAILRLGETAPRKMRVVPTLSEDLALNREPQNSVGIWTYTILLALLEAVLIILVYYLLRVP